MELLPVLNAADIFPVVIYVSCHIKTGTQLVFKALFMFRNIAVGFCVIVICFTGNCYIIGFFLQRCHAYTQRIQFLCELCSKPVNVGAFCQSFGNNLRHFIPGHQAATPEGSVPISFDNSRSSQFFNTPVGPVSGRHISKRVLRIRNCGQDRLHHDK